LLQYPVDALGINAIKNIRLYSKINFELPVIHIYGCFQNASSGMGSIRSFQESSPRLGWWLQDIGGGVCLELCISFF
jgi:hypothetical protein